MADVKYLQKILGDSMRQRVNISLNTVRTTAAFLVVISHLRALFFVDFSDAESKSIVVQAFYLASSLGHPAVIVFFVLSGYWVGGAAVRSVANGTFSWFGYGVSRMTRLWLVLIPAVLLTQILDRIGVALNGSSSIYAGSQGYHTVVPSEGPLATLGPLETLGQIFFVQSIHVPTLGTNSPLWSLAFEFWYYALFPAALVAISGRFSKKVRLLSAMVAFLGAVIAGPAVLAMFPAWLIGAAIAWKQELVTGIIDKLGKISLALARAGTLLGVLGASCAVAAFGDSLPGLEIVVALPSALMVALLCTRPPRASMLRPMSSAAEWSYSLYAIHVPILAFLASFIVPQASNRWQLSLGSAIGALGVLVVVAATSFALSQITERKTSALRDRIMDLGPDRKSKPVPELARHPK